MAAICALLLISMICSIVNSAYTGSAHHIVYMLLDDIGWSDISATGGQFPTPYIDALRADGIILDRHYIHFLCSPSRTQFLTGRRSMNMGLGKLTPFGYTQFAAIPIGQPTLANWLRDFPAANPDQDIPNYKTYGIGKWHVGYASELNTPEYKGFDHYYGFYQSGIDYEYKTHPKAEYWGDWDDQFDFFEDEQPAYSGISVTTNTMDLYLTKIDEYLDDFEAEQTITDETLNLYLYLGVQTLHGPLTRIFDKTTQCKAILDATGEDYSISRLRVCEYTLMTDDWVQTVVTELQDRGLWDDTLLVFTGDNGADIDVAACNYPLRSTKSTMFDGNIRQITFINGGDNIISNGKRGRTRSSLISNLDWTPTLLSYAGLLDYIDETEYQWDGLDIYDVILDGDDESPRDHLLLNIQSASIATIDDITSASILFYYEWTTNKGVTKGDGHLYKYVLADLASVSSYDFNWVRQRTDGWCEIDFDNNNTINVTLLENSAYSTSAKIKDSQFLFDLTQDEGETHNLLRFTRANGNSIGQAKINKITNFALDLIEQEIQSDANTNFYHEPIDCFWKYQEEGSPINFNYTSPVSGLYIMPFYDGTEYLEKVQGCFDNYTNDSAIPDGLHDLYFNAWSAPVYNPSVYLDNQMEFVADSVQSHQSILNNGYVQIVCFVAFVFIALFYVLLVHGKNSRDKNNENEPLLQTDTIYNTF